VEWICLVKIHTIFGNLGMHLDNVKMDIKEENVRVLVEFIWYWIGSRGGHFRTQ
jgi:hypothetical protein